MEKRVALCKDIYERLPENLRFSTGFVADGEIEKMAWERNPDHYQHELDNGSQKNFRDCFIAGAKAIRDRGNVHLLSSFWFNNEHGNTVTVLATVGDFCMVKEESKTKPYVLPKEFIMAIYNESTLPQPPEPTQG